MRFTDKIAKDIRDMENIAYLRYLAALADSRVQSFLRDLSNIVTLESPHMIHSEYILSWTYGDHHLEVNMDFKNQVINWWFGGTGPTMIHLWTSHTKEIIKEPELIANLKLFAIASLMET